jgi:hypothetical protein
MGKNMISCTHDSDRNLEHQIHPAEQFADLVLTRRYYDIILQIHQPLSSTDLFLLMSRKPKKKKADPEIRIRERHAREARGKGGGIHAYREGGLAVVALEACAVEDGAVGGELVHGVHRLGAHLALLLRPAEHRRRSDLARLPEIMTGSTSHELPGGRAYIRDAREGGSSNEWMELWARSGSMAGGSSHGCRGGKKKRGRGKGEGAAAALVLIHYYRLSVSVEAAPRTNVLPARRPPVSLRVGPGKFGDHLYVRSQLAVAYDTHTAALTGARGAAEATVKQRRRVLVFAMTGGPQLSVAVMGRDER